MYSDKVLRPTDSVTISTVQSNVTSCCTAAVQFYSTSSLSYCSVHLYTWWQLLCIIMSSIGHICRLVAMVCLCQSPQYWHMSVVCTRQHQYNHIWYIITFWILQLANSDSLWQTPAPFILICEDVSVSICHMSILVWFVL